MNCMQIVVHQPGSSWTLKLPQTIGWTRRDRDCKTDLRPVLTICYCIIPHATHTQSPPHHACWVLTIKWTLDWKGSYACRCLLAITSDATIRHLVNHSQHKVSQYLALYDFQVGLDQLLWSGRSVPSFKSLCTYWQWSFGLNRMTQLLCGIQAPRVSNPDYGLCNWPIRVGLQDITSEP